MTDSLVEFTERFEIQAIRSLVTRVHEYFTTFQSNRQEISTKCISKQQCLLIFITGISVTLAAKKLKGDISEHQCLFGQLVNPRESPSLRLLIDEHHIILYMTRF